MANNNIFIAPIYGMNSNAVGTAQGRTMGFPSQSVLLRPVVTDSTFDGTFNGVTVNAIIQLLPSGTVVNQPQFFTNKTVAELQTLANA